MFSVADAALALVPRVGSSLLHLPAPGLRSLNCLVWISQDGGRYPFSAPRLAPGTCEDGRNA